MKLDVRTIFAIGLGVLFLSVIIPVALNEFFAANTSTWSDATASIWPFIPLAVLAVVVFLVLPKDGGKGAT